MCHCPTASAGVSVVFPGLCVRGLVWTVAAHRCCECAGSHVCLALVMCCVVGSDSEVAWAHERSLSELRLGDTCHGGVKQKWFWICCSVCGARAAFCCVS